MYEVTIEIRQRGINNLEWLEGEGMRERGINNSERVEGEGWRRKRKLKGPLTYGRYVFHPYVRLINCLFNLFQFSASSFSSQYIRLFLKSSRCSSSNSFRFRHLSFNGIVKEVISSQMMTNPIGFSTWKCRLLFYMLKNSFISYFL